MAIEPRPALADLTWQARLAARPRSFGFHVALRRVDAEARAVPRLGEGTLPAGESVRLAQEPSNAFDAAVLTSATRGAEAAPLRLTVGFLGLWGPQGPLPTHLTEVARDRIRAGDPTLARFADVFHHRLLVLFHRAWAKTQPTVAMDRPETDRFALYVGALMGMGLHSTRRRGPVADSAKLQYAPVYARRARSAKGLRAVIEDYLGVPTAIEEFVGEWLDAPRDERWQLGRAKRGSALGATVLGARTWSRGHRFRLVLGPLGAAEYERLSPASDAISAIKSLVRQYTNDEWAWDIALVLRPGVTPRLRVGSARIGGARIGVEPASLQLTEIVDPETRRVRHVSTRSA